MFIFVVYDGTCTGRGNVNRC